MLNVVSLLLVLTAVFAYLTHPYTKLPTTIGVMASALLLSLALAALDKLGLSALKSYEDSLLRSIGFTAVLFGFGCFYLLTFVGIELPLAYCMLFGALISPTDPIAALGILKSANVPTNLEIMITGKSLLNDGVGVVLFTLLLEMTTRGAPPVHH